MSNLLKFMLPVFVILVIAFPASAQDGLTPEQEVLVDRVLQAVEMLENYQTYTSYIVTINQDNMEFTLPDEQPTTSETTETLEVTAYFIQGDEPNTLATLAADVYELDSDQEAPITYSLVGQARWVDGALYVTAERSAEDDAPLDPMPDGWVLVEDEDDWPALDAFDLYSLMEDDEGPSDLDEWRIMMTKITDISSEMSTLDDGTPVELITILLVGDDLRDGMLAMYQLDDEVDPAGVALFAGMDASSTWQITLALYEDWPVWYNTTTRFVWVSYDVSAIIPNAPVGMLMDRVLEMQETSTISDINEPLAPVSAPDVD